MHKSSTLTLFDLNGTGPRLIIDKNLITPLFYVKMSAVKNVYYKPKTCFDWLTVSRLALLLSHTAMQPEQPS